MLRVQLEASGQLVTKELIPAFAPPPEVLVWGQRIFRLLRDPNGMLPVTEEGAMRYTEAFTFVLPPRKVAEETANYRRLVYEAHDTFPESAAEYLGGAQAVQVLKTAGVVPVPAPDEPPPDGDG